MKKICFCLFLLCFSILTTASYTGSVFSADLELDDQSGNAGDEITYTVSLNNVPNDIRGLQFSINYDTTVLSFKESLNGALAASFDQFSAADKNNEGTLKVVGVSFGTGIAAGASGDIVKLTFVVNSCEDSDMKFSDLQGDNKTFTISNGKFFCLETVTTPVPQPTLEQTPKPTPEPTTTLDSANLQINNNSGDTGSDVSFTVSLNNAPNEIRGLQFSINYDTSVLSFKQSEDGDLAGSFDQFSAVDQNNEGTLKVVGVSFGTGIAAESTGDIVKLTFTVNSCEDSELKFDDLQGDNKTFSTKDGEFICVVGGGIPTPTPVFSNPDQAILKVSFKPDPAIETQPGRWEFEALIEETNGIDVTITGFEVTDDTGELELEGNADLFSEFFSGCGDQPDGLIPGFDTACADLFRTGLPGTNTFSFFGIDENGNSIEAVGQITFLEDTSGKSFTFECDHELIRGDAGLEWLVMEPGDSTSCVLKLTDHELSNAVDVAIKFRTGINSSISVDPLSSTTDNNNEIVYTINAIEEGVDWVTWAVPNENGEFVFSKKSYDRGLTWGMFVKVKQQQTNEVTHRNILKYGSEQ